MILASKNTYFFLCLFIAISLTNSTYAQDSVQVNSQLPRLQNQADSTQQTDLERFRSAFKQLLEQQQKEEAITEPAGTTAQNTPLGPEGFILNETYSKLARDFYDLFYRSRVVSLRPYEAEPVRAGVESKVLESLRKLPKPKDKIVAAVYRFRDETGQQSFGYSTAATWGATSILVESMENSGWFTPVEREDISKLLNEWPVIQSKRRQNNDNTPPPPLIFAGIVLEGGIIGFESNVITRDTDIQDLGMEASDKFRKDQVTIYLRAVSTLSGRVLNTVQTSKSVLSQKIDTGIFRFFTTDEILESKMGITFYEPAVIAVTEAIDEAVKQLVVENVDDGLWQPADQQAFADYKAKYPPAKAEQEAIPKPDLIIPNRRTNLRNGFSLTTNYSYGSYIGNSGNETLNSGILVQFEQWITSPLSVKLNFQRSEIGSEGVFSEPVTNIDLLINAYITPQFNLSPYAGIGVGLWVYDRDPEFTDKQIFSTFTAEAGLDYRISNSLGVNVGFNYRYFLEDGVDGIEMGSVNEQQWSILTGLSIYP